MDLEVFWHPPIELRDGKAEGLIYYSDYMTEIPETAGVYVFGRTHGDNVEPIYIGKAGNLRRRIRQHFETSIRLMHRLQEAKNGTRVVLIGEWKSKKGQQENRVLPVIERMLIKFALAEGYELFNEKGTKTPVHTLSMTGSRTLSSRLFRRTMKIEQK